MRSGPHGLARCPQVVQLAKKWQILTGKWLLSVPEWRIDVLWLAYACIFVSFCGFTVGGKNPQYESTAPKPNYAQSSGFGDVGHISKRNLLLLVASLQAPSI